jgi:hypothetical protein
MIVSGTIDDYPMINRQLAPTKWEDKMLSINQKIRNAIWKKWWDFVKVTLYFEDEIW